MAPRRMTAYRILFASVALASAPLCTNAQDAPLELTRLDGEITFDGRPDEPAWQQIAPLPLTMYLPVFGGAPTQRSEIRVAYDDDHLYLAGWFYDDGDDGVRVNSLYRDNWNGDDAFAIYIDAFNDNRNAKWFGVTPAGMRFDQLVSDDGQTLNGSWDGYWDARSVVDDEGWFTEVRIPFSTLGFQTIDDRAVMGLTVTRLVARLNERVTFPAIGQGYEFRQPSVAQDVVLTGVRTGKPMDLTPYLLTGVQRSARLADAGSHYISGSDMQREIGLDARYALSSELTLDVTLNTDFAQVEADDQQVNLDRFSLFFPEKRRFFQERSELFDFAMGGGGRLFHSRQIGLAPQTRVPVLGGARVVGRIGSWDVAALDMHTDAAGAIPGENFGVARVKRRVLNDYSEAGGIMTTRLSDGAHNVVYGLDANIRVFGHDYITAKWSQSFDSGEGAGVSALDRAQWYVNWQRRTTRGLMYQVNTTRAGSAFAPRLGFLPRRDFTTANVISEYYVFTDSHPWLRRVWPGALAFSTFRNGDGVLESGQYAVWLQWQTKAGGGGWIEPKVFVEDVAAPFTIADATVPAGRYRFADLQLFLQMGSGSKLRASVDARAGTWFDGTRAQIIFGPTWNVSRHMELGAQYQHTRLRFDDRGDGADIHVANLRVRGALDARASATALIQYSTTTDRVGINLRARYNFSEGTDLWLVYDEALATEREDPTGLRLPLSTARALVLKYTRTLRL